MKTFYKLLLLLLMVTPLSSCQKELILNADVTEVSLLNSISDNKSISIQSNLNWTVSVSDGWVSIDKKQGTGDGVITVKAGSLNGGSSERSATITITGEDGDDRVTTTVTVKQVSTELRIVDKPDLLEFSFSESGQQLLQIESNCDWEVSVLSLTYAVFRVSPFKGTGNGVVSIVNEENNIRKDEHFQVRIASGSYHQQIEGVIYGQPNESPEIPELISPENGEQSVDPLSVTFSWRSEDPDGDELYYYFLLSEDGENWKEINVGQDAFVKGEQLSLKENTTYFWRIKADDQNKKENSISISQEVYSFTTGEPLYEFLDGRAVIFEGYESLKEKPVKIVFTGDGYIASDFLKDGKFGRDMKEGIESFFSVEPFKTYKEYFTVYVLPVFSQERGVSITSNGKSRQTAFGTVIAGAGTTQMSCNDGVVFNTVTNKIEDVDQQDLKDMTIIVIANEDYYAGTCYMWSDGMSIALVPTCRQGSPGDMTYFGNILIHEAGGHGWGKLADEYASYTTSITEDEASTLTTWQGFGVYKNVVLSSDINKAPWNIFYQREGYGEVGMYEGGYYYASGVWRSEHISCMINNISYFPAWCRYLQVERILKVSGEEFTLEKFLEKDRQSTSSAVQQMKRVKAPLDFKPLHPPVLIQR